MQATVTRRQAIGGSLGLAGFAAMGLRPAWGADEYEPLMKQRMSYKGKKYEVVATLKDNRVFAALRLQDGTKLAVYSTEMDWLADDKVVSAQVKLKDGTTHSFWMEGGKPVTDIPGMTFEAPEYSTQAGGAVRRFFGGLLAAGLALALVTLAAIAGGLGGAVAATALVIFFVYALGPKDNQPSGSFRAEPGLEEQPGVWY